MTCNINFVVPAARGSESRELSQGYSSLTDLIEISLSVLFIMHIHVWIPTEARSRVQIIWKQNCRLH